MPYGPYEQIAVDCKDGILTLTLHRPEKLNAFTGKMMWEMIDVFTRVNKDDAVGAVIVTGAGRAFCAGADLSGGASTFDATTNPARKERDAGPVESVNWSDERVRDGGGRLTLTIFECLKPVIAAVNGAAVGVGVTMLLPMDIRIASRDARFGFVFARRGIVPEAASSWFLPRIVGISKALEWCYSGRVFDAGEAHEARLVNELTEPGAELARAHAVAREIVDNAAPVSLALIRQMMWRGLGMDHPMEAHKVDSRGIYARGASADVREGVSAFLEKRKASFPMKVSDGMPPYFPWWQERNYS
ncbi:MAG: crotonase/enoyl-CoA hydratase family protein [Alphaproteobacteria bacterium]|nr:crotonase/enoyl-CoA hydratase family protein [Alphaproteobacteria bacterium]MBV9693656.1 crotonase/enoyl-CoA hydratase family protein [Alphaproteobacteria bacterium]